jgi:hypothetical protein
MLNPLLREDLRIYFAEPSFRWSNLASKKAAVIVSIIGVSPKSTDRCRIFSAGLAREVGHIGPYLVPDQTVVVHERREPLSALCPMSFGSMPNDGGGLLLTRDEAEASVKIHGVSASYIHKVAGSKEFINGIERYCIWVKDDEYRSASNNPFLLERFMFVERKRGSSSRAATSSLKHVPYKFGEVRQTGDETVIIVAKTSSENREYFPVSLLDCGHIITEAFGIFDGDLYNIAFIASTLHKFGLKRCAGR